MKLEVFKNDLYKDPLTGRANFFSFMQCNFHEIFGNEGAVLIIDIANFTKFNDEFGRNNGDLSLKCVSNAISNVLQADCEALVFRTHGDEFTSIFPNKMYSYVKNIRNLIDKEYKILMNGYGFYDVDIHTLILNYESKINSIEEYYELLLKNSLSQSEQTEDKFSGDRLLRHIIGGITNRVRDTLSYYKDAYDYALIDDVSELANHRAGKAYLVNLLDEYKTNNLGFSVLFIDGDNLRRYNEISYEAGNEIIRKLGQIITRSIRNKDKVYRWLSGDEFLVVLKGDNEINAFKLANRIRVDVEEQTKDLVYPTTISIGVACCPNDGVGIEDIINKAEKANALAKSLGKNKVVKWNSSIKGL